jgi:hypothetical protein
MSEFGPEIEPTQEPFIIRTHHLALLRDILLHGDEPEFLGRAIYANAETIRGPEALIDNCYKVDVYGVSESDKKRVIQSDVDFFQSFMDLPDEHPIELSTKKKDAICNSCIIGQHCDEYVDPAESRDFLYHYGFISTARKLDLSDKIMITAQAPDVTDANQEKIPTITTTAGTVKKVLPHKQFSRYLKNPEANQNQLSDYWHKLYPIRAAAGTIASLAAVSTIFNAGQLVQATEDSEQVRSAEVKHSILGEVDEDFEDAFKSALIMSVSGIVYVALPRRRKRS